MASNGPVPGNGRLSNSDSLTNMLPCHALSIALYHWLRDIDPPIEPTNARAIFISRFKTERLEKLPNSLAVNSCLVKDTGARERVFLSSFEPGSSGQKALRQCFEYQGVLTQYPASAFPLLINEEGRATMAGRTTYDEDLIRSYLNAIHNTNLAAFDTMATARIFKRRADVEISFLSRRIDLARERLESMKRHQIQDQPLYKRLATQLAIGDTRRNQLRTGRLRAVAAGLNANRSAARAYELASSNFSLCRNGLHRIDGPVERYLIGKELVFSPILTPASEDDFLTEPQSSEQSVWLQKNLNIAEPLSKAFKNASKVKIESMPLDMVLAEHKASLKIHPTTIIFDSRDLESKTPVPGHIASIYPFANLPVPEAQLFYYAKHAHVSGNDDKSSDEQSPPIA
ncbi:MAG: hypothetical protein K8F91_16480, partial [Candidatus Obscuribacterales bacterium]|nr:hypothetical protein [Candidatus Obscuribacterales bacterium]